jgi:hypothetical protein
MTAKKRRETTMARQAKTQASDTAVQAEPQRKLIERLAEWMDSNDWKHDANPEKGTISTGCNLKDVSVRSWLEVHDGEDWQRVMTLTFYPARAPEARRAATAEAINRINQRLVFGNFEMDPEDGEIRFRTTVEAPSTMDDTLFDRVFHSNLSAADRYFPALMAVAYGNSAPASVLDLARPVEKTTLQ